MDVLRVTYQLRVDAAGAEKRAEEVAREQTVEVPRSAVTDPFIEREVMGRVEAIAPDPDGGHRATIAFPVAATALDPAQLINVIFGNSSLHDDVACVGIDLPSSVLLALQGPRFGIAGLRKAVGVYDRALTCTAAKPMGLSPEDLAERCRIFARAGIDVIKDDHGLADQDFGPFERRVELCLAAVDQVADETGQRAVYVPNLIGTPGTVFRQLDFAQERGARAVMASPMLIGLPVFWELCHEHAGVPVMAHPALAGLQRFAPEVLLGRLFRLYGADAVIYVNFGSRFDTRREQCRALADNLIAPWGNVAPALPVPAGGIAVENAAEVASFYGPDSMLLITGSLQADPDALAERARFFVESVHGAAV